MTAVKTSGSKGKKSCYSQCKKWNRSDNDKMLYCSYRTGSLCKRAGIAVENGHGQEGKMIGPDKGYIKDQYPGNLPPYPVNFPLHKLFYPYTGKTEQGGI